MIKLPRNPHISEVLAFYPLHFQMKSSAIIFFLTANYNERNSTAATFTGVKYNFGTSLPLAGSVSPQVPYSTQLKLTVQIYYQQVLA